MFAATSHSRIIQFFVSKNLNNIYTDYTENLFRYTVLIGKFTQLPSEIYIYHSTADYGLVPDSLEGLSVFRVCSLITGHPLCMLGSGELSALHSMRGKISRDSWRVGDCNHVRTTWLRVADNCTLRLQFMHRLFHHSVGGKISRCTKQGRNCRTGWSTETVRVTCNCIRHSLKGGVFTGGCQAVIEIMCRTNWSTHYHRTGWREIKIQIN